MPYLQLQVERGVLKLSFQDPEGKPFWISRSNVTVLIQAPQLRNLTHQSNSALTIDGITGKTFELINGANGNVSLTGKVETFQLVSQANGQVNAQGLQADSASILTEANATIRVNTRQIKEIRQAHANVINVASPIR